MLPCLPLQSLTTSIPSIRHRSARSKCGISSTELDSDATLCWRSIGTRPNLTSNSVLEEGAMFVPIPFLLALEPCVQKSNPTMPLTTIAELGDTLELKRQMWVEAAKHCSGCSSSSHETSALNPMRVVLLSAPAVEALKEVQVLSKEYEGARVCEECTKLLAGIPPLIDKLLAAPVYALGDRNVPTGGDHTTAATTTTHTRNAHTRIHSYTHAHTHTHTHTHTPTNKHTSPYVRHAFFGGHDRPQEVGCTTLRGGGRPALRASLPLPRRRWKWPRTLHQVRGP